MTTPAVHDLSPAVARFRADVLRGLRRPHKRLPCKYFYDDLGSRLFDRICELPEYYPTRTELGILRADAPAMAARLGPDCLVIEYGSGSGIKTRLLLDAVGRPAGYLPVDIARDHLERSAAALAADYPGLTVLPVCADFTRPFALPPRVPAAARRVIYFPGSTIGNFGPGAARRLLAGMAEMAGAGGTVLIGVDLKKDPKVLEAAYDDAAGVTAAFNTNLLARINRELGGDFRLDRFAHHALYDPTFGRVEMHLVSRRRQTVRVAGESIEFEEGEGIRTECSYKFTVRGFQALAASAGLRPRQVWTDPRRWFSVQYLVVT
ncbi:MAG TPA: L-histidine N(alpha)-methyltransferase [Gemmataceae bacterium]|jgi:dimethylhistidine N-methyltransferase